MVTRTLVNSTDVTRQNLLINGAFDFFQYSTSTNALGSTPLYAGPDRWTIEVPGAGSATASRDSADVPNSTFEACLKMTSNTASAQNYQIWQRIETSNCRPFIGKTMTLSMWIKDSSGNTPILKVFKNSGATEDTWPSAENDTETLVQSTAVPVTAGVWTRISTTFTMPVNTGIVIGVITTPDITINGHTRRMTGCMLTEGNLVPTHFYRAGYDKEGEFAKCQRYFEVGQNDFSSYANNNVSSNRMQFSFNVYKRTTPTMQILSPSTVPVASSPSLINYTLGNLGISPSSLGQATITGGADATGWFRITGLAWSAKAEL